MVDKQLYKKLIFEVHPDKDNKNLQNNLTQFLNIARDSDNDRIFKVLDTIINGDYKKFENIISKDTSNNYYNRDDKEENERRIFSLLKIVDEKNNKIKDLKRELRKKNKEISSIKKEILGLKTGNNKIESIKEFKKDSKRFMDRFLFLIVDLYETNRLLENKHYVLINKRFYMEPDGIFEELKKEGFLIEKSLIFEKLEKMSDVFIATKNIKIKNEIKVFWGINLKSAYNYHYFW